jgi:hypothetical protein
MADENNNIPLQTDNELLEAAKNRLAEAREKAAAAGTVEEVDTWNNEIDAAKLALENLVNELTRQEGDDTADTENKASAEENEENQESKENVFGGHTIILGGDDNHNDNHEFSPIENNGENNHIPSSTIDNDVDDSKLQKELKETKKRLNETNLELGELQGQHEALKTRHKDLKDSIVQSKIATIAEQKELQDKYNKASDTAKTLVASVESLEKRLTEATAATEILKTECDANIKNEKETLAKELERKRQELEATKGSNEQIRCDMIKLALAHLGHTAPENFKSEKDGFYNNILKLYDFIKIDLLTRYDWKFALEKEGLNPAGKIEGSSYFTYELPKNLLKIQKVTPNYDYEIMGNTLRCMANKGISRNNGPKRL